jgi:glycosyltransferase involved in cell wall biosynthesis
MAEGAAQSEIPLDLTVYFSGNGPDETLGPRTRLRHLSPVFSTANLKFLPYVPDHTDLAPYHPRLARELAPYDVIHTTDGFFNFARTAAHVSRARGIPLVNSIHTDTPSYARIFTRMTIEKIFGTVGFGGWLAYLMIHVWKFPDYQERAMQRKLVHHLGECRHVLVTRPEDHALAEKTLGPARVHHLRRGIDKKIFGPQHRDRAGVERDYRILPGSTVVLFVGRVDIGKNIYTLLEAMEKLVAEDRLVHLIVAGVGPAMEEVKRRLGGHASTPGFIEAPELARLYASADALAIPSEVETHSMVGLEAMASGCPILVAQKSGIHALFDDTAGMQVVASASGAWAAALEDFVARPEKGNMMRAAAVDYSRGRLAGWDNVLAEDLFPIWQQAAGWPIRQREAA